MFDIFRIKLKDKLDLGDHYFRDRKIEEPFSLKLSGYFVFRGLAQLHVRAPYFGRRRFFGLIQKFLSTAGEVYTFYWMKNRQKPGAGGGAGWFPDNFWPLPGPWVSLLFNNNEPVKTRGEMLMK